MKQDDLKLLHTALKRARDALESVPEWKGVHNSKINRALKFADEAIAKTTPPVDPWMPK